MDSMELKQDMLRDDSGADPVYREIMAVIAALGAFAAFGLIVETFVQMPHEILALPAGYFVLALSIAAGVLCWYSIRSLIEEATR